MDFIFNFLDQVQKSALFLIVQKLGIIDWVLIFAVLVGMAWGSRKGVGEMFGKVLEILVISILVLTFYPKLTQLMIGAIPALSGTIADPISFVVLSVFLWLSVAWLFNVFGKLIKIEVSGSFKSLGGLLCGAIYFFLLVSFASQFLLLLQADAIQEIYQPRSSYSGSVVARTVPAIQSFVVSPFGKGTTGLKNPLTK